MQLQHIAQPRPNPKKSFSFVKRPYESAYHFNFPQHPLCSPNGKLDPVLAFFRVDDQHAFKPVIQLRENFLLTRR